MVDDVEVVKHVSRSTDGTGSTAGGSEEQSS